MTAALLIVARLNVTATALTPIERWAALHRLGSGFVTGRWLILPCIAAVIVLTMLLIAVSLHRVSQRRRLSRRLFLESAGRLGLTARECRILQHITARVKLNRKESIFTMLPAFERGAAAITKETLAVQGAANSVRLGAELSVLREKLGFEKRSSVSMGSDSKPGSRQIPPGKKLYITGPSRTKLANVESTVIKNSEFELVVKLASSLECNPGEQCRVRYNFGVSVWEFDADVVSCHGGILVLGHTSEVRFINRRRFLRVPVSGPAFIARFPFARTLPPDDELSQDGPTDVSAQTWSPPEFVPAEVTELAGPGLRLVAPLEVKVGDRVVVILKISEEGAVNSTARRNGTLARPREPQKHRRKPSRIVEDIGEVKHAEVSENGFSIAVELTRLSDSNVNELIRATNAASVRAAGSRDPSLRSGHLRALGGFDGEDYEMAGAAEPALVRGT